MTRCGRVSGHQLRTRKCPPYIPMAKARGSTADSVDDYRNRNDGKKRETPQRCGHAHARHQHGDSQQQEETGQHLVLDHVHDKCSHEKAYACDSAGNEYIKHLSFLLSVFSLYPFLLLAGMPEYCRLRLVLSFAPASQSSFWVYAFLALFDADVPACIRHRNRRLFCIKKGKRKAPD